MSFAPHLQFLLRALVFVCLTCNGTRGEPIWPQLSITPVASDFTQPVHLTHANDQSDRIFIVEQPGQIRVLDGGITNIYLDLSKKVTTLGAEQGLLSIAFPIDFHRTRRFYVNYTRKTDGATVVSQFQQSKQSPLLGNIQSEKVLLVIPQFARNHNGGGMAFHPENGYLYIGTGDGGRSNDPHNNGQDLNSVLGKMLRIDVHATTSNTTYGIPVSNPFSGDTPGRDEIWAFGLRNPWRFSFDSLTHDLYIADVGQDTREEIDVQLALSSGGENYGWRMREGFIPTPTPKSRPVGRSGPFDVVDPAIDYPLSVSGKNNCSVTGGFVYRKDKHSAMYGKYFYADYCSGRLWGLTKDNGSWTNRLLLDLNIHPSSFGTDESGNLYLCAHREGIIYQVEAE